MVGDSGSSLRFSHVVKVGKPVTITESRLGRVNKVCGSLGRVIATIFDNFENVGG